MVTSSTSKNEPKKVHLKFELTLNVNSVYDDMRRLAEAVLLQLQVVTHPGEPDDQMMQRWYSTWIAIFYMQAKNYPLSKVNVEYEITPGQIKHDTQGFGDRMNEPQKWTDAELREAQQFVNDMPERDIEDDIHSN